MTDNSVSISATHHSTILDEEQARKIRFFFVSKKICLDKLVSFSRARSSVSSNRSNDSILLANELNDTLSYLDSIEQLLLLTSISFNKLPTASFNNRVRLNSQLKRNKKQFS
jgi:hypothetical protein